MFHELLGPTSPDFPASVYLERHHHLSYEHVLFAEINGDVAGMTSAFTTADHAKNVGNSRWIVARAAGIRIVRMAAVAGLGRRLFSFMDAHEDGDTHLQAVAVDPAKRGEGIGSSLINSCVQQARAVGSQRLALDVDITNSGAIALYERQGWSIVATSQPTNRFGSASVHRLVKPL